MIKYSCGPLGELSIKEILSKVHLSARPLFITLPNKEEAKRLQLRLIDAKGDLNHLRFIRTRIHGQTVEIYEQLPTPARISDALL